MTPENYRILFGEDTQDPGDIAPASANSAAPATAGSAQNTFRIIRTDPEPDPAWVSMRVQQRFWKRLHFWK